MAVSGIYRIINKKNGKFYVGSSSDIKRRCARHLADLKKNKHDNSHLQNTWNVYGCDAFDVKVMNECSVGILLAEEQRELDGWAGKVECYNIRTDATCPVKPGEHRSEDIKRKISMAQKGIPKWNEEQKQKMSVDRIGRIHSKATKLKMKNRISSFENIRTAQQFNDGRIYSNNHCSHISEGKLKTSKVFTDDERNRIKIGVKNAILEGRYHKNKVPKEEYETIRNLYLSGDMNQRKLAFKYSVNPGSMCSILKKLGVK